MGCGLRIFRRSGRTSGTHVLNLLRFERLAGMCLQRRLLGLERWGLRRRRSARDDRSALARLIRRHISLLRLRRNRRNCG
jgi:hypothetical protein